MLRESEVIEAFEGGLDAPHVFAHLPFECFLRSQLRDEICDSVTMRRVIRLVDLGPDIGAELVGRRVNVFEEVFDLVDVFEVLQRTNDDKLGQEESLYSPC